MLTSSRASQVRVVVVLVAVVALLAGLLAAQVVSAPPAHAAPAYPVADLTTENITDRLGAVTTTSADTDGVDCQDSGGGNVRAITGLQANVPIDEGDQPDVSQLDVTCRPFATPAPKIDRNAAPKLDSLRSDTTATDYNTRSTACTGALVGLGAKVSATANGEAFTDLELYCEPLDDNGVAYGNPLSQGWMIDGLGDEIDPVFCAPGSFAIGIQDYTADLIYGLSLVCDAPEYDPAGVAADFPHTTSSATVQPPLGDADPDAVAERVSCGDGTVAVSLSTEITNTGEGSINQLTAAGVQCSAFSSPTLPTGVTPTGDGGQAVFPGGPHDDLQTVGCETDQVLTGVSARGDGSGALSSLSAYCSALGPDGAPTGTPALVGETGLGEGPVIDPVFCPAGTAVTGFDGEVSPTAYDPAPTRITLICSTFAFAFATSTVVPQPANSSWTTATLLNPTDSTTQAITSPGGALWYRFPVQPSSAVSVDLTGLAQDDDLAVFSDIGQAFTSLTSTADLTRLSAEFAGVDFAPTTFSPTTFSPTTFSPTTFSPTTFSPTTFSPTTFSPTTFSPTTFSPTTFSPTTFSPTTFSPTTFSPDVTPAQYYEAGAFVDQAALAGAYSSAQTRSVLGVSAHDGLAPESLQEQTFNHTGYFYVRVTARNGAVSPQPFSLAVTTTGGPCSVPLNSYASDPTLIGTPGSVGTVVLTDSTRLTGSAADVSSLAAANRSFTGYVGAALVDVAGSQKVRDLQAQATANPGCPYAKNLVAQAVRDIVNSYRSTAGTLKYVVIEGNDSVIPFFRYADDAGVAAESGFSPPVTDISASDASLRNNMVLGQDAYGSLTDVTVSGISMPVPDLAVGRVVETPAEIAATLNAYVAKSGAAITPTSTLATGYDFLAAGAQQVAGSFAAGDAAGRNDTLITNQGVDRTLTTVGGTPSPSRTWTASDLRTSLFGSRHDVVYLAGHFSGNAALAADFSSVVTTRDLAAAPAANFANTLVFSAGCHSGYNIVDPDAVAGVTDPLDWAQAFAQKGATLVAGTGYQYGDTDFVKYSNELYVDFARALRVGTGAVAVGTALAQAKHDYLAGQASLDGVDQKSLLEATLFGLPMQGVNFSTGRLAAPVAPTPVSTTAVTSNPGQTLGLSTATINASTATTPTGVPLTGPNGTVAATYLSGPGGAVEVTPAAPTLPLVVQNATAPAGTVLRGVGFRSGTYTDQSGVTPLTGAPATETNTTHGPFVSDVFYPNHLATPNYFDALSGSPATGATRLMVTPAQYRSDAPGSATDVQRTYSALGFSVFYSGNRTTYGANVPAAAAPPSFSGVVATPSADNTSLAVSTHVVGDPSAGVQQVWVTWTDPNASTSPKTWQSVDLVQDSTDSTLWSATITLPAGQVAPDVQFIVQAVNGVGVVGADDAAGHYYRPVATGLPVPAATSLTLGSAVPTAGVLGGAVPVSATLLSAGAPVAGQPVTFGLGGSSIVAVTNASGVAATSLPITAAPGAASLTASFAGTATFAASAAPPSPLTVARRTTAATVVAGSGGYRVSLTDTTVAGHPVGIAGRAVYVAATGAGAAVLQVLPLVTDANGQALVTLASLPAGTTALTPYFASASTPTVAASAATFDQSDPSFAPAPAVSVSLVPSRITVAPAAPTTTAGVAAAFSASAYYPSAAGGLDVTPRTAFTITPTTGGASTGASCNGSSCTATTAGTYTVTATFLGRTASTTLRVTPGAAVSVRAAAGTPQTAASGSPFTTALAAQAVDGFGNPVPGASVTFQVPAASGTTGAATFAGGQRTATVTTGASGLATAPTLTAGAQTGPVTATATLTASPSAPGATYQLTVTTAGTTARADLSVAVSAPSSAPVGGTVTVTVTVTNRGPAAATRVGTVLAVPWDATVTSTGGGTAIGRQAVLFTTASLASGATVTYRATVTVGRYRGVVLFGAGTLSVVPDPTRANNLALTLTQVR